MPTPRNAATETALPLPPADAPRVARRRAGREAAAAPRRRHRRVGAVAGLLVAAAIAASCDVPVQQWVPDRNGDGHIDEAEVAAQQAEVARAVAAVEAHRRAVQAHPFLACVRASESDRAGGYLAQNPVSSASGAYQFLDSTWRNVSGRAGHPGYARALHAPWYVQDAVALWLYENGGRSAWAGTGC